MTVERTLTLALAFTLAQIAAPAAQAPSERPGTRSESIVSTAWLADHARDPGLSILHVGANRQSYDAGHIPGARFVALADLVTTRDGIPNELRPVADLTAFFEKLGIGNTGPIVAYGDGHGLFAARLLLTLEYLGHGDRVALLDGGLETWRGEGRPIARDAAAAASRPFTARLNPDVLVTLPVVRDISWGLTHGNRTWALIDARPEAQFAGSEADESVSRAGHIPGAANVFWERLLVSRDRPVLRPPEQLRDIMRAAGVADDGDVVTYCRTGVQASFAYFVARYLGYRVKMYDGSFLEWSGAKGTEVVTTP